MTAGGKKYVILSTLVPLVFVVASALVLYAVVPPSPAPVRAHWVQAAAALVSGLLLAFYGKKGRLLFSLDLKALESVYGGDGPETPGKADYGAAVDGLGALPFKTFLAYLGCGFLSLVLSVALNGGVLGFDPFRLTVSGLFNLSFLLLSGSFLYVLLDRTLLRHLLSFSLVRFPSGIRDLRQKRKNVMIPIFMTIMALISSFSVTVLLFATLGEASIPPMALMGRLLLRLAPIMGAYLAVVVVLVLIWTKNTAILYQYLLERLDQMAAAEKDLTGRIHIASVDELSSIKGRINDITEVLQRSLGEVKQAFDAFVRLEEKLLSAVDTSVRDSADIGRGVDETAAAAEKTDALVEQALSAGERMRGGVMATVDHVEQEHDAVGTTVASMRELLAQVSSAALSASDVRGRVGKLVDSFGEGSENVRRSRDAVLSVVDLSEKLREINDVISGIAARTNLLAMNAAIEAAHAGAAGAGFSVVASEIRALAEGTAGRTKESKESLKAVLSQIRIALDASERTTRSFEDIRTLLDSVDTGAAEIAAVMAEQDQTGKEIARRLEDTTTLTADTLRLAEELGTSTEDAVVSVRLVGEESRRLRAAVAAMREHNRSMAASISALESAAAECRSVGDRARTLVAAFKT